jgi:hypothetical protein
MQIRRQTTRASLGGVRRGDVIANSSKKKKLSQRRAPPHWVGKRIAAANECQVKWRDCEACHRRNTKWEHLFFIYIFFCYIYTYIYMARALHTLSVANVKSNVKWSGVIAKLVIAAIPHENSMRTHSLQNEDTHIAAVCGHIYSSITTHM